MDDVQKQSQQGMTFDEYSMQKSSSFLTALQELKNLRPQLYFAADQFENSYLESEQKRKVLETSKEYAADALVNAVDHLGNVASKLNDLISNETADLAATELRIDCLKQKVLTCKEHGDGRGLRQQYVVRMIPRFHKHYVLPANSAFEDRLAKGLYIGLEEVSNNSSASPNMSGGGTPTYASPGSSSMGWKDVLEGRAYSAFAVHGQKYPHSYRGKRFFSSILSRRKSVKYTP